jgi:hypothetical protein
MACLCRHFLGAWNILVANGRWYVLECWRLRSPPKPLSRSRLAIEVKNNGVHDQVAMHAVPVAVLHAQPDAVGLPLWTVPIPSPSTIAFSRSLRRMEQREAGPFIPRVSR